MSQRKTTWEQPRKPTTFAPVGSKIAEDAGDVAAGLVVEWRVIADGHHIATLGERRLLVEGKPRPAHGWWWQHQCDNTLRVDDSGSCATLDDAKHAAIMALARHLVASRQPKQVQAVEAKAVEAPRFVVGQRVRVKECRRTNDHPTITAAIGAVCRIHAAQERYDEWVWLVEVPLGDGRFDYMGCRNMDMEPVVDPPAAWVFPWIVDGVETRVDDPAFPRHTLMLVVHSYSLRAWHWLVWANGDTRATAEGFLPSLTEAKATAESTWLRLESRPERLTGAK